MPIIDLQAGFWFHVIFRRKNGAVYIPEKAPEKIQKSIAIGIDIPVLIKNSVLITIWYI